MGFEEVKAGGGGGGSIFREDIRNSNVEGMRKKERWNGAEFC